MYDVYVTMDGKRWLLDSCKQLLSAEGEARCWRQTIFAWGWDFNTFYVSVHDHELPHEPGRGRAFKEYLRRKNVAAADTVWAVDTLDGKCFSVKKESNMKTVGVKFYSETYGGGLGYKVYDYVYDGEDIAVGDHVVVAVAGVPKCVKVTKVVDGVKDTATKMVMFKVSDDAIREHMDNEKRLVEKAKERKAALKRLLEIEQELDTRTRFQKLAEVSDEARSLLALLD